MTSLSGVRFLTWAGGSWCLNVSGSWCLNITERRRVPHRVHEVGRVAGPRHGGDDPYGRRTHSVDLPPQLRHDARRWVGLRVHQRRYEPLRVVHRGGTEVCQCTEEVGWGKWACVGEGVLPLKRDLPSHPLGPQEKERRRRRRRPPQPRPPRAPPVGRSPRPRGARSRRSTTPSGHGAPRRWALPGRVAVSA